MIINLNNLDDLQDISFYLGYGNKQIKYIIHPRNVECEFKLNQYSEISFDLYRKENEEIFDIINGDDRIYIDKLGWWISVIPTLKIEDGIDVKSFKIYSIEYELSNKNLNTFYINTGETGSIGGDYQRDENGNIIYNDSGEPLFQPNTVFYNPLNKDYSLLNLVFDEKFPNWSIQYVHPDLVNKYRTFSIDNMSVYSFLTEEVAKTLKCIFIFDTDNYTLSVYPLDKFGEYTDIYISNDSISSTIESSPIDETSIVTAIRVYGQDDMDIRIVNCGNAYIYNLSYYYDKMSEDLYNAWILYTNKFVSQRDEFRETQIKYNEYLELIEELHNRLPLVDLNSTNWEEYGIDELQVKLTTTQQTIDNYIEMKYNVSTSPFYKTYLNLIKQKNNINKQISIEQAQELEYKSKANELLTKINQIKSNISFDNNFTPEQILELNQFIKEGDYSDETYVLTSIMTEAQKEEKEYELLISSEDALVALSQPQYQVSTELTNLLKIKDFNVNRSKFQLGNYLVVYLSDTYSIDERLISFSFNLDNLNDLKVTFSNSTRTVDGMSDLDYMIGNSTGISSKSFSGGSSGNSGSGGSDDEDSHITRSELATILTNYSNGSGSTFTDDDILILQDFVKDGSIDTINANYIATKILEADEANIENLQAHIITADYVESHQAVFENLQATDAVVRNLMFGSATGTTIQTSFSNSVITTLGNAWIKNAMIDTLSADKINSGSINTNNIEISSENGNLVINDNTISIYDNTTDDDGNKQIRVQIGETATKDDYNLCLWNSDGNLIWDAQGLCENGLPIDNNAIIKNQAIASNANIQGSKLDIDSVISEVNENGSTTLNSSKIYVDSAEQTVDVLFGSMTTDIAVSDVNMLDSLNIPIYSDSLLFEPKYSYYNGYLEYISLTGVLDSAHLYDIGNIYLVQGKTYILNGVQPDDIIAPIKIIISTSSVTKEWVNTSLSKELIFTSDESFCGEASVVIQLPSQNYDKIKLYPMIRYSNIEDDTYVPYTKLSNVSTSITTQGTELNIVQGKIDSKIWEQDIKSSLSDYGRNFLRYTDLNKWSDYADKYITSSTSGYSVVDGYVTYVPNGNLSQYIYAWTTLDTPFSLGNKLIASGYIKENTIDKNSRMYIGYKRKSSSDEIYVYDEIPTGTTGIVYKIIDVPFDDLEKITMNIQTHGTPTSGSLVTNNWQIEIGEAVTTWKPAIEDTNGNITIMSTKFSDLNQDLNGFKTEVSETYSTIGGTNILSETKDFSNNTSYKYHWFDNGTTVLDNDNFSVWNVTSEQYSLKNASLNFAIPNLNVADLEGKEVTFSMLVKCNDLSKLTNSISISACYFSDKMWMVKYKVLGYISSNSFNTSDYSDKDYCKIIWRGVLPYVSEMTDYQTQHDGSKYGINIYIKKNSISNETISIKQPKLEYGLVCTSWNDSGNDISTIRTVANQTAEGFSWLVESDSTSSNLIMTDKSISAIANKINISGLVEFSALSNDAQNDIQNNTTKIVNNYQNLFILKNTSKGYLKTADASFVESNNYITSDYIGLSNNTQLNIKQWLTSDCENWIGILFFDENKTYITGKTIAKKILSTDKTISLISDIPVESNACYVRVYFQITNAYHYKVSMGNVITNWSAAPEDSSVENVYYTNTTTIDGGKIATNTITASSIKSHELTGDLIYGGKLTSLNYTIGDDGVISDGSELNLNDGSYKSKYFSWDSSGKITSTSGTIGGWTINNYSIYRTNATYGNSSGMYFGVNGLSIKDKFKVSSGGVITASDGTIGAFNILSTTSATYEDFYTGTLYTDLINSDAQGTTIADKRKGNGEEYRLSLETFNPESTVGYAIRIRHHNLPYAQYLWEDYYTLDYLGNQTCNHLRINSSSHPHIYGNGTYLTLAHSNNSNYGTVIEASCFRPASNESYALGNDNHKWGQIYSTTSTISTSDRNEKNTISSLDDIQTKNLIMSLNPVSYKFNNGTSDRLHYGLISQDVEKSLNSLNISTKDFAGFIKSPKTETNNETLEETVIENEYVYGLRYEEFIAPMINVIQQQQKEIDELKQLVNKINVD